MESLKELVQIIKDLPEMSLWILAGFAFYKTFTFSSVVASIYYISKLLIEKVHDVKTRTVERIFKINSIHISDLAERNLNNELSMALIKIADRNNKISVNHSDLRPLINAIRSMELKGRG